MFLQKTYLINANDINPKQFCASCKEEYPEFFIVPGKEWDLVVPKRYIEQVLCFHCYSKYREKKKLKMLEYKECQIETRFVKHYGWDKVEYSVGFYLPNLRYYYLKLVRYYRNIKK